MLKVLLAFIAFLMSIFAYSQQNYQITENKEILATPQVIIKDLKQNKELQIKKSS